jgi:hypothetical protein
MTSSGYNSGSLPASDLMYERFMAILNRSLSISGGELWGWLDLRFSFIFFFSPLLSGELYGFILDKNED